MTTHHSHPIARLLAAGLVAAALAAPAAVAQPANDPQTSAPAESASADAPVVRNIDEGFDWGSAAIGAGGAGALFVLVSLGGVTYVARHRAPVPR
jgi:hypothetical protein